MLLKTALKPDIWSHPLDLKLAFFDKILLTIETPSPNIANICTALELLTYILSVFNKEQILLSFKPLQRGIGACITSNNTKIIKLVHNLLTKLMQLFPMERTNANMSCKYEDLEVLYSTIGKVNIQTLQKKSYSFFFLDYNRWIKQLRKSVNIIWTSYDSKSSMCQ